MSDDETTNSVPQSEQMVLGRRKSHDIAMKAKALQTDLSKFKTVAQMKTLFQELEVEFSALAESFLTQESVVKRQKMTIMVKNREIAELKQSNKVAAKRSGLLTDALAVAVLNQMSEPKKPSESQAESVAASMDAVPQSATSTSVNPEKEPSSIFGYSEYRDSISSIDLDQLDMENEAKTMTPVAQCDIPEDEPFQYAVPMHLMGIVMGRQKVTLKRIINQTATEIEPISWVVNGSRVMGFKILGAPEAIAKAVNQMLLAVKFSDNVKARKLIAAHLVTQGAKKSEPTKKSTPAKKSVPTKKPETTKPEEDQKHGGSKSGKVCVYYAKGSCTHGSKCRFLHKNTKK